MKGSYQIFHDLARHRFYCKVDGLECVAEYRIVGGALDFYHTYVPPELRGKGIAGRIYGYVVEYLEKNNLKAIATCSYAEKFFERYPSVLLQESVI